MLNSLRFSWDIEGQPYEVEVDLRDEFTVEVLDVYTESGSRLPIIDYEAHGFTCLELDIIAATALKMDRRGEECRCGERCRC